MASTNKTTNFNLPQWQSLDKPTMQDFNDAFKNLSDGAVPTSAIIDILHGGTGATTASQARSNLGISTSAQSIVIGDKLIQFGFAAATTDANGGITLSFPTPFADTNFRISIQPMYSSTSAATATISDPTTAGITAWFSSGAAPIANKLQAYHWIAIGNKP